MNERKNSAETVAEIPVKSLDALIACADGDAALLYIHIARTGGFSLTRACLDLKRSEGDILRAAETLRRLGLVSDERELQNETLPQYTAADITLRAKTDPAFEGIVFEAQKALGKTLNSNDLNILFGIYDHIGLPADMIFLLLNHCIDNTRTRYGEGRTPTMKTIEAEAWFWSKNEINTFDAAEEHIHREKQRGEMVGRVKAALQIGGRSLTPSETRYINDWLEMGFTPEALAEAYDRTVVNTGKLAWKYMNSIVTSWHEKNLHTLDEINAGDARFATKTAPAA
ncbi:MAG: DnaD domain protein [Oscillospiraceae bacterium]|nr:DnaD domain protein [Oscillospiraceae bacterium]